MAPPSVSGGADVEGDDRNQAEALNILDTESENLISVLVPSRQRGQACWRMVQSVLDTASCPGQVEILLGVDADDPELEQYQEPAIDGVRVLIQPAGLTVSEI